VDSEGILVVISLASGYMCVAGRHGQQSAAVLSLLSMVRCPFVLLLDPIAAATDATSATIAPWPMPALDAVSLVAAVTQTCETAGCTCGTIDYL